ncbi:3-oxoacyl-[acyl-carrier-protein] reductase FabG-like [Neocloeon triangulifer]|uniref:3-oxoacyl-[acyl-carrier-protein] reductase FabG-like n=1 Tax=Neocloeon triangulifer TaxID=2078957 RepID=UPI00286F1959|nr:3-oxoacyl-[acyl-carrier-protein] reductase FabG-like [Neocloeon triangulifer]XP_059490426.1 3-oxoacyl-[acyl-carrier-protein] reductase FabG-like [Neocloeon triangulifer]
MAANVNFLDSLKDKVVIVTGASSGIGAQTAVHFAKLGSQVVITGRNAENLEATKKKCIEAGAESNKIILVIGDVTKASDCKAIVQKAIDSFGRLDCLVNNAGILVPGSVEVATEDDYNKQMDANVKSVFLMTSEATPHLIASKGNVVNVSSVCGIRAFPGICVYNMSKAAVDQFTESAALDLASKGVRVNAVNPGVIVTEVHKRAGMNEEQYQKYLEHSKTTHALGRVGNVEEVASVITFLASSGASYITGAHIPVDGGRHAMCPR